MHFRQSHWKKLVRGAIMNKNRPVELPVSTETPVNNEVVHFLFCRVYFSNTLRVYGNTK